MTSQCDYTHLGLANRRCFIAGLACTATLPMAANAQLAGPPTAEDVIFMRMAIEEARLADFPFGAVIVRDGAVMARGRNMGRTNQDPTAHGEMDAIRKCLAEHGPATLRGSTLYTSGEPCAMCMGVVFAASVTQLATKIDQIMLSSAEVAAKASFAPISRISKSSVRRASSNSAASFHRSWRPLPIRQCLAMSRMLFLHF
jgi:pyrimidine deaminase RibD-like protein